MVESRVVGFGGAAGSGKTTAAEILVDIAEPTQHKHLEFSEPIIEAAQSWLGRVTNEVTCKAAQIEMLLEVLESVPIDNFSLDSMAPLDEQYVIKLFEEQIARSISPETKNTHRPLLEWLGRSAIQLVSPNIWDDAMCEKINRAKESGINLVTVSGVRTIEDYKTIKRADGTVIRLSRSRDLGLPSEYQLNQWPADFDIQNNGSLGKLRQEIEIIWDDLEKNNQNAFKNAL